MYYKLPVKERMDLMKSYKKANPDMSYHDMVKDYNDSYEKFQDGGKKSFNDWYKTVPSNKADTSSYNLRRAYELAPQKDLDNFVKDPNAHLYSTYENKETGIYEFMKSKNHPTIQKELEWFNSNDPEAIKFRKNYKLDTSKDYYQYVPQQHRYGGIQKFGDDGKVPFMKNESDKIIAREKMLSSLSPRDFKAEKANYETQTRGANQMDGSGISSAELAYKYAKLIDPSGITSVTEIAKNAYNKDKQDPFDYLGLIRIPYVQQGMKVLPKLTKQVNKLSLINNVVTKSHDLEEAYK